MTERQIKKYVIGDPFRPFRLVLDTGEQITVQKPRKALLSGPSIAVVGISRTRPGASGMEKLRIVRLERITSVEPLNANGM